MENTDQLTEDDLPEGENSKSGNLFDIKILICLSKQMKDDLDKCSKKSGKSRSQWIREAITDRISLTMSTNTTSRLIDVPMARENQRSRADGGPVTITGMKANARYSALVPFIEQFIDVSKKHKKLNRAIRRTKDTKVIYFQSHLLDELIRQMKDENWNSEVLLKALDTSWIYNGDVIPAVIGKGGVVISPERKSEWGVADFEWLMTKKRGVGFGWTRVVRNFLSRAEIEDEEKELEPIALDKCRPIASFISKGQNFIEGSNDANRVLDYVYEKTLIHGYDKVREIARNNAIGPDGWANFKKAFRDIG